MVRRGVVATAVGVLTLGLLPAIASAEPDQPSGAGSVASDPVPDVARGLVVKTSAPDATLQRATERATDEDVDVLEPIDLTRRIAVVDFATPIPTDEAAQAAVEVAERADVEWAIPNRRVQPAAASPVTPTDPLFKNQHQLWDTRATSPGGYSTKAPSAWRSSLGTGVVVAVLDTGVVTSHPDLRNRLVAGYDMIGADQNGVGAPLPVGHPFRFYTANDGNGRDADPSDPGDWIPRGDTYCYGERTPALEPSSWHGTHVSGIVAAQRNNKIGISGVAPDARVQPVRVLGRCGGWDSDILAGIEWASGGTVTGVPANRTPADVLNLSLGRYLGGNEDLVEELCQAYGDVMGAARERGAVSVVAAGNELGDADLSVPAACPHAISVAASSRAGRAAFYTNTGASVDVAAPGGDVVVGGDDDGIVSATDLGETRAARASHADSMGTSMAAPAISGAVALLLSAGVRVEDVEEALGAIVAPFNRVSVAPHPIRQPVGTTTRVNLNCTTSRCGDGIVDLSKAPLPITPPSISGSPVVGSTLTATTGTWVSGPTNLTWQWTRDGTAIPGAVDPTYVTTESDRGSVLAVRAAPTLTSFTGVRSVSAPTRRIGVDLTLSGPSSSAYGSTQAFTASVRDESGPLAGRTVRLQVGTTTVVTGRTAGDGTARLVIPARRLSAGAKTVSAVVDEAGSSWASTTRSMTVAKAKPSQVRTSMSSTIRSTKRLTVKARVVVPGVPDPTGIVRVYSGPTQIGGARPSSTGAGLVTITARTLKKRHHTITVRYLGSSDVAAKTSGGTRVRVY